MSSALRSVITLVLVCAVSGEKEASTGITFGSKHSGLQLMGTGVRTKGPIKVYATALYVAPLACKVSSLRKYKGKEVSGVGKAFYQDLVAASFAKCVVLKMAMGVSKEKLVGALSDSLLPRMASNKKDVTPFSDALLEGCKRYAAGGKASKGTELAFGMVGGKLSVKVNGNQVGSIKSNALCKALLQCYMDDKSVSPSLKRNSCAGILALLEGQ